MKVKRVPVIIAFLCALMISSSHTNFMRADKTENVIRIDDAYSPHNGDIMPAAELKKEEYSEAADTAEEITSTPLTEPTETASLTSNNPAIADDAESQYPGNNENSTHDKFGMGETNYENATNGEIREDIGSTINQTVHIIWISNDDIIPDYLKANIRSWEENNPTWNITLWDMALVRSTFDDLFVALIERLPVGAWKGDVLRYKILYEFGGLYVDADIVNFRSIDKIVKIAEENYDGAFSVCERLERPSYLIHEELFIIGDDCATVCNAVIGCRKNHPAVKLALNTAIQNTMTYMNTHKYNLLYSGPPVWTDASRNFNIGVLKIETFYPCMYYDTNNCVEERFKELEDHFAMHQWKHTWGT